MTMRTASPEMTVCEYLRLINDTCQGDSEKDKTIRELCAKGEKVGKLLGKEVSRLNPYFLTQKGLYQINPDWRKLLELRLKDDYKQEGSNKNQ